MGGVGGIFGGFGAKLHLDSTTDRVRQLHLGRLVLVALTCTLLGSAVFAAASASAARYVVENWDPSTGDWRTDSSLDFTGWEQFNEDPELLSLHQDGSQGHGLYGHSDLSALSNGAVAEWRYTPPGASTIFKSEYEEATFNLAGCMNEGMRLKDGEWEETVNEGPPYQKQHKSYHPTACGAGVINFPVEGQLVVGNPGPQVFCAKESEPKSCGLLNSPLDNSAAFGVERFGLIQTPFSAYLRGVRVYETSYVKPYFTAATNTIEGWVHTGTGTITPTATETGMGMKTIKLISPNRTGGTGERSQSNSCTGTRLARCPATWNKSEPAYARSFSYGVDELPEGIDHFGVKAVDIVENESLPAGSPDESVVPPTKVDRTAPADIVASGELAELANHYINGQGTKTVGVSAIDNLSGIRSLSIEDDGDGVLGTYTPLSCVFAPLRENQCPLRAGETLSVDTGQMPEGANHLRIVAEDLAGNVGYGVSWTVYVDRTPPAIELSGSLTEGSKEGKSEYLLHVHATDGDAESPGSGVRRITISVDDQVAKTVEQSCELGNCPMDVDWAFSTAAYGAGGHDISVTAEDQTANQLERSLPFFGPGEQKAFEDKGYWLGEELWVGGAEPIPNMEPSLQTQARRAQASASVSGLEGGSRKEYRKTMCGHTGFYAYTQACGNPFTGERGFDVVFNMAIRGAFLYKPGQWAKQRGAIACAQHAYQESVITLWYVESPTQCEYGPATSDGNGGSSVDAGHYLRAQAHWPLLHRAHCGNECNGGSNPTIREDAAMELHLYPSGNVEETVHEIHGELGGDDLVEPPR